ncbi:MAG: hypothetical protein ACK5CY_07760 [Bacteroidia bacterium]
MRQVMVTIISVLLFSVLCSAQNILKHPITGAEFEVAPKDFTLEMNYKEANDACKQLKDDWRLPTIEELETMYKNKGEIVDYKDHYWAEDNNWFSFKEGKGGTEPIKSIRKKVRAVRSIKEGQKKITDPRYF